ncbi:MAG TPA: hypothetical protein VGI19_16445 [Candidatus Cybelea sp.]
MSIARGRDGRTLLHCYAGCSVGTIAQALGIGIQELFGDVFQAGQIRQGASFLRESAQRAPRNPSAADLRDALAAELQRYRVACGIEGLLRTAEINEVRAAIAQRFGVELAPVRRPLREGGYGGRERDPLWPQIFEWAMNIASIQLWGIPSNVETLPELPILLLAEDLAADAMRSLERDARRAACEPTA